MIGSLLKSIESFAYTERERERERVFGCLGFE
jgi:hypothetical protein